MVNILVVDDQESNRDLLTRRLSKRGYDVLEAASGQEALRILDSQEVGLVLLDVRMPGMNGEEVLREIRKTRTPVALPVIMVTAEDDSATMVNTLQLGADDYVTKPIDFPVLLARIENKLALLESVRGTSASATSQDVTALIAAGENQHVEFKSTLRWNINAGQIGKEISTAWAKSVVAFLNSDGGTLLVGVDDDGEIIGTELDKFKSDDRYLLHVNNTIKDMIGLEYASHISYQLVPVGEKKILRIDCRPYPDAVFLNNGGVEEFYARFGPSSRHLTTREVLAYMQKR